MRNGIDPGGALPKTMGSPGSAAMHTMAEVYHTFNTHADTRSAECSEKGCRRIQPTRSRPAGEQQTDDGKRARTGASPIAADPAVAGVQFMESLGQAPMYPEKPLYIHQPTGKRYTRALFTAASIAHNGCVKPCCAKWIDTASPCPMEEHPFAELQKRSRGS